MKKTGGLSFGGVLLILAKVGPKLAKVLPKLIKLALFGASAASYTVIFGWKVAVMILLLLFLHEGGHLWAMKKRGMKTKGMYFIPFMGAAAVPDEAFSSRESENFVALMGPTVGLLLSVLAYVIFVFTGDLEFVAAAGWMAVINLLNLLPILPLDGGRVLRSISFSFGSLKGIIFVIIGMVVGAAVLVKMGLWLFVIIIPIGLGEVIFDFKREKKTPEKLSDIQSSLAMTRRDIVFYEKNHFPDAVIFLKKKEKDLEKEIKRLSPPPRMSSSQLVRGIVWTVLLVVSLFLVVHYSSVITGDQSFYEILK
jgi:Zn-dependent protease